MREKPCPRAVKCGLYGEKLSMIRNTVFSGVLALVLAITFAAQKATSAPDYKLGPEEQLKLKKLTEFLAKAEEFLPTVNQIDKTKLPATFPFDLILDHIVVDVAVGDSEALPFMFDTGAPTFITPAIAKTHGGDVIIETVSAAGGGKLLWTPMQSVASLKVENSLSITNATAEAGWKPGASLYCVTPHGLLGAPAMRNAIWQINYDTKNISVAASLDQLDHIEGAIKLPFTVKPNTLSPSPRVELGVGNGTLTFIVDTGGGIPLTINTAALAKVGLKVPDDAPVGATLAGGAAGSFESRLAGMTLPLKVGNTEMTATVLVGNGMAPTTDGNMGHMFLKNFVVTFDWSTGTMFLDPLDKDGNIETISDAPAAGIGLQDGKVIVSSLALGGPADKAGLTLGETVTRVDGKNVDGISRDAFCALRYTKPQKITTEAGKTFDVSPIKGFFSP